jgi:hypothetical protein
MDQVDMDQVDTDHVLHCKQSDSPVSIIHVDNPVFTPRSIDSSCTLAVVSTHHIWVESRDQRHVSRSELR